MYIIVSVLVLIAGHVSRVIDDVLPACDSFSFARLIETLLRRSGVFGRVG